MHEPDNCELCRWLEKIHGRQVTWCPSCQQRESVPEFDLCVRCHAARTQH